MTNSVEMAQISTALERTGPLDLVLLVHLSRKSMRPWLHASDPPPPIDQVERLWHRLMESAGRYECSDKYLNTACNAVSVFLNTTSKSQSLLLKSFVSSEQIWMEAYQTAQGAFHKGKTKPALQVLETLSLLLNEHSDKQLASNFLHHVAVKSISVFTVGSSHHDSKVACVVLSCLIKRTPIAPEIPRLTAEAITQAGSAWFKHLKQHDLNPGDIDQSYSHGGIILLLLMLIKRLETRSAALKLLALICTRTADGADSKRLYSLVAGVTIGFLDVERSSLDDFADNVFPIIISSQDRWWPFVDRFRYGRSDPLNDPQICQYLVVLRLGRLKNFINDDDIPGFLDEVHGVGQIESQPKQDILIQLLRSSTPAVKILTFKLLLASQLANAPISARAVYSISQGWDYLHLDNDAHERGEILSVWRRMLQRIDHGLLTSANDTAISATSDPVVQGPANRFDIRTCYATFLEKLVGFLRQELLPGISYPRHILAIEVLRIFLSLASSQICNVEGLCKPVLNLILDPFEDVRVGSIEVCKLLFNRTDCANQRLLLWHLGKEVEIISTITCRHDHADAAGRLSYLAQYVADPSLKSTLPLERLGIEVVSASIVKPGSKIPLHALLLGAHYYLSTTSGAPTTLVYSTESGIFQACCRVWDLVQGELCIDSPEKATSDLVEDLTGPKDLLAYSWRALRDSSLLLQAMLQAFQIDRETLNLAGMLCIEQLTKLRHRGAFSTVAQTFTVCCELARSSSSSASQELVRKWYLTAVHEIGKQAGVLTRRSAGLPALINAVLSPSNPKFFDSVLEDLQIIAAQSMTLEKADEHEIELPQVHALNCLKDIIHNSRFRAITERYIDELLNLGASSMSSDVWAVSNSGLMLLKACMVRLETNVSTTGVGGSVNGPQSRRGGVLRIVVNLLEQNSNPGPNNNLRETTGLVPTPTFVAAKAERSVNIFVALDLVNYVGGAQVEDSHLHQLIRHQLGNKIWAIRDHAARILVKLAGVSALSLEPSSVCPLPTRLSENELHGHLLFYRYYLQAQRHHGRIEDGQASLESLSGLLHTLSARISDGSSPFTKAALLDIANDGLSFMLTTYSPFYDLESSFRAVHRKCGSTTNPYCLERSLLSRFLFYLFDGSELTDRKFVHIGDAALQALSSETVMHPDGARYVFEQLQDLRLKEPWCHQRCLDVVCRLCIDASSVDVRALALTVLANFLEPGLSMADWFRDQELRDTRGAIRNLVRTNIDSGPELRNASLRIWAFLSKDNVRAHSSSPGPLATPPFEGARELFSAIWLAGQEETDFTSRHCAAIALQTLVFEVASMLSVRSDMANALLGVKALLMLYDQLNDDDEEIRGLAVTSATKLLCIHRGNSRRKHPSLSTKALREAVIGVLLEPQGGQTDARREAISLLAIGRVVGCSHGIIVNFEATLENQLTETVEYRLQQAYASMTDLFAEEKQNLYVDDLEEVTIWNRVLEQCGLPVTEELSLVVTWVLEGLDQIEKCVCNADKKVQVPLGPTYNSEILILFVRVVSLGSVLSGLLSKQDLEGRVQHLTSSLDALKKTCVDHDVHDRLLMAFSAGGGAGSKQIMPLSTEMGSLGQPPDL